MCPRSKYTDLTYMGGTEPCDPIKINFGKHIRSWYTILNIKFGVNRMFHVHLNPVYRFDLYEGYHILSHLQAKIPNAACAQDPNIPI